MFGAVVARDLLLVVCYVLVVGCCVGVCWLLCVVRSLLIVV